MEESEKRKERLRAMRMEASQAHDSHSYEASVGTGGLSNPLVDSFSAPQDQAGFQAAPRFDFYTDPMAAFSAHKRRSSGLENNSSSFSGQRNVEMTPHLHQMQNTIYQSEDMYGRGRPLAPDIAYVHQVPHVAWNEPGNPVSNLRPRGMMNPASMHHRPPPEAWSRSYSPVGIGSSHPGFAPPSNPNFHHDQGRFHGYGHNRFPGPGSRGSSPGPFSSGGRGMGRGGRRGIGSYGHGSAYDRQQGPDRYFNESMLEDPWKDMEPVLWVNRERKWLPKSVGMKKPRVSGGPGQSSSGPSLAEYLAAAVNEAVDEIPENEVH